MSRNAKRSATSNSSTNHHESAQVLSSVDSADASAEQRKKSTSRRRIELGVGAVILAGVLYLPFSPLLSMTDPSQANTPAADATVPTSASLYASADGSPSLSLSSPDTKLHRPVIASPDYQPAFEDVPEGSAYYDGVRWAVRAQVMDPDSETLFGANNTVTRGELIRIFYRLAGSPSVTRPDHSPYEDVDESDPNYDAYLWAREQQITSGWNDGKFHPEAPLSNASTVALLHRADGSSKIQLTGTSPFSDVTSSTPFYRQIVWASRRGVSTVSEGDAFAPTEHTSKARVAMMLYLYFRTL
ncbi:S-layer homology domain-containing protein [Rothia mucilaginosa]|jgi:putative lysozyme like protein|uniref:S-layer homology domain-containing protein n=1 Tax=Rothia mucilaginosa TaxID=43675 RepID=UPI0028EFB087|nr:S-layer homology domain-containing protein [uncultured Rothia sp.]